MRVKIYVVEWLVYKIFVLQKKHEFEISNLKMDQSIKIMELEDKIKKMNNDIDIYRKNSSELKKEIDELRVIFFDLLLKMFKQIKRF